MDGPHLDRVCEAHPEAKACRTGPLATARKSASWCRPQVRTEVKVIWLRGGGGWSACSRLKGASSHDHQWGCLKAEASTNRFVSTVLMA